MSGKGQSKLKLSGNGNECKPLPAICPARISALPWNLNARIMGHHRLNSFIQFPSVDFGTTTMCGPVIRGLHWSTFQLNLSLSGTKSTLDTTSYTLTPSIHPLNNPQMHPLSHTKRLR